MKYVLALASSKTGVVIHAVVAMSTHLHLVVTDKRGRLPEFLRELHRGIAKALNVAQKRREALWSSEHAHAQVIADHAALVDRIAYLVANPVEAGAVEEPEAWPGTILWKPGVTRVRRPEVYFDPNGRCPDEVELVLERPEVKGWPESLWRQKEKAAIGSRVLRARERMARERRRFSGPEAVAARSFTDRSRSWEPLRALVPMVAATERKTKRLMLFIRDKFRAAYREALLAWKSGDRDSVFPRGTWLMVQQHGVLVAALP